jgi:hypothetical protein
MKSEYTKLVQSSAFDCATLFGFLNLFSSIVSLSNQSLRIIRPTPHYFLLGGGEGGGVVEGGGGETRGEGVNDKRRKEKENEEEWREEMQMGFSSG